MVIGMAKEKNEVWEWIKALFIAVIITTIIRYFLFTPIVVEGYSMMPTLQDGDKMIVNKLSKPERFDIIVFHAPEQKDYIKRVIGLPGDRIEYKNDVLYINGEPYEEPYLEEYKKQIVEGPLTEDFTLESIPLIGQPTVPEGELFVLGDNRRSSKDSRHIGTIPIEDVIGDANIVFWPLKNIRIVK